MLDRILSIAAVTITLGACATETRVVVAGDDACTTYGFRAGTAAYSQCKARELAARQQGRVVVGYSDAQIGTDSRAACHSYGLAPGTAGYERCVQREIAARRPV